MLPEPSGKGPYVKALFDQLAPRYDLVNDLMTGGLHRVWKNEVVRRARVSAGDRVLDACCGTGDIAGRLAKAVGPTGHVIGLDFSGDMLAIARRRFAQMANLAWVEGDVMQLPFAAASFEAVTVGYGLRNVSDLGVALAEIWRVLKPGGRLVALDVSQPQGVAKWHLRWGVPLIGRLVGQAEAYQYLPASADAFLDQQQLEARLKEAGFEAVQVRARWSGGCLLASALKH